MIWLTISYLATEIRHGGIVNIFLIVAEDVTQEENDKQQLYDALANRSESTGSWNKRKNRRGFDKFMRRGFEACRSKWSLICALRITF